MAAITTIIAAASLAVGAASAVAGYQGRKDAQRAARRSAEENRKIQAEQRAANAAQAAQERRQQVREERVRRARILQASENTGGVGSSGEGGALSSLSTQLGANIGFNLGAQQRASNISTFAQNAADFNFAGQRASNRAANADTIFSLSGSLFNAAGGFNSAKNVGNVFDSDPLGTFIQERGFA